MRKILLIVLLVVIAAAGGWYWYARSHQTAPGVPAITDFSAFFPVGETGDPTLLDGLLQGTPPDPTNTPTTTPSPFRQLSPHPVAGFVSYMKPLVTTVVDPIKPQPKAGQPRADKAKPVTTTTQVHTIRYISRATGYVYEIADGDVPLQISNVYIPNIYEALFGEGMNTALLRFLRPDQRTIATYSVPIPPPNTDGTRTQREGTYFPDTILQSVLSPDNKQVAYLTTGTSGATITLSSLTNTKKTALITTPFREWLLSWPSTKSLYVQTKPSAQVPGFLYRIDTGEKKLRRVLGDINGLTTSVSPSGTYVLYSQHSDGGFVTRLLNTKTGTTRSLTLAILPEKCTWLANEDLICAGNTSVAERAEYPDAWYQGSVAFSDQLYRIATASLVYETLYDNSAKSFDMTNLQVNETSRIVYFIDKSTGLLWQMSY